MKRPLKVLHCPLNNGNNAWVLSRAERKLGLKSDLVVFQRHPFYDNFDELVDINFVSIPNEWKRLKFLSQAIKSYDIFHFNYGQSIWDHPFFGFNYLDLPLLKRAGKKIVFSFQGDDARNRGFFFKKFHTWLYSDEKKYTFFNKMFDRNRRLRIKKVAKFADRIFAFNPDIMYGLPKNTQFQPYSIDIEGLGILKEQEREQQPDKSRIRIVHAPTNRVTKGTELILGVIKDLSLEYPIQLDLIENTTFSEAVKMYAQADIAIDQLLIGWYGGFAAEMMALGKPVIAYLRQGDLEKYVPFWREIPIVNANTDNLKEAIESLIKNPQLRVKIGQQGRNYVEKYHNPLKIAAQTKKIYEELCAE